MAISNNIPPLISAKQLRLKLVEQNVQPCCVNFWYNKFELLLSEYHWLVATKSTKEERLKLLHWKILHNIYPTNILLHKMGLRNSPNCSFCNENDYMEHFFWFCSKIKKVWTSCIDFIFAKTNRMITLTVTDALFGYCPEQINNKFVQLVNHIILIAKVVISKFKYGAQYDINAMFLTEVEYRSNQIKSQLKFFG